MTSPFYKSLYPETGLRVLAVFKGGLKNPPTHTFYDNDDDLIEAADTYSKLGKNAYHGCAVYETDQNRKGENVARAKAVWIDLDVGPAKPYATQREAAEHAEAFRNALGLPRSFVVSSGNGVHVYYTFTKSISPENWDKVAAAFAQCMDHFGVKHDTSRTQDKASILRIPGTSNYKTDPSKPVVLKREGEETAAGEFYQKLKDYAEANGVIIGEVVPKGKPLRENKMMGGNEYPPSEGDLVAENCPVLFEVADTGGDVPYEVWWRSLGVAKHTTEPDAVAAEWTRHRANTGHERDNWKPLMDTWATGPTTCSEFNKHSNKCQTCPHFGKIKSPIQLGVPAQPAIQLPQAAAQPATPVMLKPWTFMADWVVDARCKATRTGFTNGQMTRSALQKDGSYSHVPFCDSYWQLMRRIRTVEGVWQLEIGYVQYEGMPYKTFLIDSSAVSAPEKLKIEFSAREIHIYGGPPAVNKALDILRHDQKLNQAYRLETPTYPTMGWASEGNSLRGPLTGEFVLGDIVYRPKEPPKQILLADTVDVSLRADFTSAGTADDWAALINHIYNRPGAEAYQFVIASMFGAPLVRLMPGEGEWHGIPLVLGGDTGAAKTTTALAAVSIYAPAQVLRFSAQGGQGGQGDTINALSIKMGSLRNIPFIMDEMTGAEAEKVSAIAYMCCNGKSKDRMNTQGKMVQNPYRWDLLSIITSNDSLHEVLEGVRNSNTKEAGQIRLFQIDLKRADLAAVFSDVNRNTIDNTLLGRQYGKVGQAWIQFLVNNREKVQEMLGREREHYMINPDDTSEIRFYKDLLITTRVAATLAKRKGFIDWDVGAMMKWAEGRLVTLRDFVAAKDWDGTISDFIGSLHGRTIITKHVKLGPGKRSAHSEVPLEPLSTAAVPAARKAVTDRRFVVTVNAVRDWATKNKILPKSMLDAMIERGYIKNALNGVAHPKLINIGSGSTVVRPQAPCYELDFDKVSDFDSNSQEVDMTNVVQLPVYSAPEPLVETVDIKEKAPELPGA